MGDVGTATSMEQPSVQRGRMWTAEGCEALLAEVCGVGCEPSSFKFSGLTCYLEIGRLLTPNRVPTIDFKRDQKARAIITSKAAVTEQMKPLG